MYFFFAENVSVFYTVCLGHGTGLVGYTALFIFLIELLKGGLSEHLGVSRCPHACPFRVRNETKPVRLAVVLVCLLGGVVVVPRSLSCMYLGVAVSNS